MKLLSLFTVLLWCPAVLAKGPPPPYPCPTAYDQISHGAEELAPPVRVPSPLFDQITGDLRESLSGNLATVLRSEWKAKGDVHEANRYVHDLVEAFLTPETRRLVTNGTDPGREGYIRSVAKRLYDLGEEDQARLARGEKPVLQPRDLLSVRDPAAPVGARDYTLTYYTRPLVDEAEGKHQLRVRNYLRVVEPSQMEAGQPVAAFARDGRTVTLRRLGADAFELSDAGGKRVRSAAELRAEFGEPLTFFAAPHGGKFKLEIKTRLKDMVSDHKYPRLGGKNFVQKLDVSLSPGQVAELFAPLPASPAQARVVANARLSKIQDELLRGVAAKEQTSLAAAKGEEGAVRAAEKEARVGRRRAEAVMKLLRVAVNENPDYLHLEGSTLYSRSAFEVAVPDRVLGKAVKVQTTVDRDLGAFPAAYDANDAYLDPVTTFQTRRPLSPVSEREQRHFELKFPKPMVDKEAGVRRLNDRVEDSGIEVDEAPTSPEARALLEFFSRYNVTGRGKFNHTLKRKPIEDAKPTR